MKYINSSFSRNHMQFRILEKSLKDVEFIITNSIDDFDHKETIIEGNYVNIDRLENSYKVFYEILSYFFKLKLVEKKNINILTTLEDSYGLNLAKIEIFRENKKSDDFFDNFEISKKIIGFIISEKILETQDDLGKIKENIYRTLLHDYWKTDSLSIELTDKNESVSVNIIIKYRESSKEEKELILKFDLFGNNDIFNCFSKWIEDTESEINDREIEDTESEINDREIKLSRLNNKFDFSEFSIEECWTWL